MGGPRVTSGEESKQDYATDDNFLVAVTQRFGPIQFDLAAHAGNAKHTRYFAPKEFVEKGTAEELGLDPGLPAFTGVTFLKRDKKRGDLYERRTPNVDPKAYALDAFAHAWSPLSAEFRASDGGPGLLWLNCEFGDVTPWAARCLKEMGSGANITLLTPVAIANWFRDHIAGRADTYLLSGRLCFDGKNVFPKDCMVSHFHPGAAGLVAVWDWQADRICAAGRWEPQNERLAA